MNDRSPRPSASLAVKMYDADDAFLEFGRDDAVLDWNRHATALFGWSAHEILGRSLGELLLAPACRSGWERRRRQLLALRPRHTVKKRLELIALHRDGHEIPIEFTITVLQLPQRDSFIATVRNVSAQRKVAQLLDERTALLHLCREAVMVADLDGRILFWGGGAEQMYGWLQHDAIGCKWQELMAMVPATALDELAQEVAAHGSWEGELLQRRRDGTMLTALCRYEVEHDEHGNPARLLMTAVDLGMFSQVMQNSALLRDNEQRFQTLFQHHSDGVFSYDPLARMTEANLALAMLTGYAREELLSMHLEPLVAEEYRTVIRRCFLEAMRGKPQACELVCVKKDGSRFDASITLLPDIVEGKVAGVHGIVKDVSHRRQNERRIEYLANHDSLTGLPNRNLLEERMKHAIDQSKRANTRIGVLFMDLNRFKVINDSLGHEIGDLLLRALAKRLESVVRDCDTVARLGGDEFVVLLENIRDVEQIAHVADNLLNIVRRPVELAGHQLVVSTSIGASVYPDDGDDAVTLFKNADLAMYAAKSDGDGLFRLYDAAMNARALQRLHHEGDLRQALALGEFVVHYQPRLAMASNTIVGTEALVRWNRPGKGLIYPASFIPLAEEIGLINGLGEWVMRTACRQLKDWQDEQLPTLVMSVNLSAVQLASSHIRDIIASALADAGVDARLLELEITESSLMQNIDRCVGTLHDIRQLGVRLSIDDFGTGYSSLSYLKRLPIDTLKIDKSFVGDIAANSDDAAIVSAAIAMAHSMNLKVVAEGVTSYDQKHFLEACNCDEIQGYLLCQPLPPDEAAVFFRTAVLRGIAPSGTA